MEENKLFNPEAVRHRDVIRQVVQESSARKTYIMLIIVSTVIAAFGLLSESLAIVIGAMLVAPLLWPVLGLAMGLLLSDWRMVKMSAFSIGISMVLATCLSIIITQFYVPLGADIHIIGDIGFWPMLCVAAAAGAAAAFAISYENVKEAVTGVAIAVALLPPLASIGIGLGGTDWDLMRHSVILFFTNLLGIVFTAFVIFGLLGYRNYRRTLEVEVKKEEKVLES